MKKLKVFIGILISLIFIYIVFRRVDFGRVLHTLLTVNYFIILPAVIIQVLSYWTRSIRWSLMLTSIKKIKASRLFPIICLSYLANNILPLRAGELVRAYLIGEKEGISKTAAFSTVILERIYDGITLVLFFGAIAFIYPFPLKVKIVGALFSLIFFGALIFIILIVVFRDRMLKFTTLFLKILPEKIHKKIYAVLEKLIDGFDIIKDRRNLLLIAFYSVLTWLMEACLIFAIATAFGFSSTVYLSVVTLTLVNFLIMIPSSPGYIGTFEGACTYSLSLFGIVRDTGVSFALIYRVFQYVPITVLGFVYLFKEGVSLTALASSDRGKQQAAGSEQKQQA